MYDHKLIFENQAFEIGMTNPVADNADCESPMRVGGQSGYLCITVLAGSADVAIADGKILTISYTECATEDGSFAAPAVNTAAVRTFSGAYAPALGDVVARMIIPVEAGKWVLPNIATDDAAADGLLDVVLEYLAN